MNDRNEIERNMYAVEESIVFRKPREKKIHRYLIGKTIEF